MILLMLTFLESFAAICIALIEGIRKVLFKKQSRVVRLGFFHPFCNSGGGGERVLWCAIKAIEVNKQHLKDDRIIECIVFSGDTDCSQEEILLKVSQRFGIYFSNQIKIKIVYLNKRHYVDALRYPRFTMIGQSVGSIVLAAEALCAYPCDFFIETTGYAFTYPLAYLAGCEVVCYTHYPTITTEMLSVVQERRASHNNDTQISNSPFLSQLKVIYYILFAKMYSFCGRYAKLVMVNGTWTHGHIKQLWGCDPHIVFPPCDTECLQSLSIDEREPLILSLAQFRPEKNHSLQLLAFKNLRQRGKNYRNVRLVLIGSVRGKEDEELVERLKVQRDELGFSQSDVFFAINVPYGELQKYLAKASIGLHTMWNEHFGISVVEMMAAGVITIAHNSGGPKFDIVKTNGKGRTGYLASTAEEYADAIVDILKDSTKSRKVALTARKDVALRFLPIMQKNLCCIFVIIVVTFLLTFFIITFSFGFNLSTKISNNNYNAFRHHVTHSGFGKNITEIFVNNILIQLLPKSVGIMTVSDSKYMAKFSLHSETVRCYAAKHGYDYFLVDPNIDTPECMANMDFFFRKHCSVKNILSRLPQNYKLFVFDGDVVGDTSDKELTDWIEGEDEGTDLIFYERSWGFEIAAGNYFIRNTEFSRRFLFLWASFEHNMPRRGFSSSDQGAIHLVILEMIGFRNQQMCFDLYHGLFTGTEDLQPYYDFVACTRTILGPGRRWVVPYGDLHGTVTILNRYMGWVLDSYTIDHSFGSLYPFGHGVKSNEEVKRLYNPHIPTDKSLMATECYIEPPNGKHIESREELIFRILHSENWFAMSLDALKSNPWRVIPRWRMNHCLSTWSCHPLNDDNETPESRGMDSLPFLPTPGAKPALPGFRPLRFYQILN